MKQLTIISSLIIIFIFYSCSVNKSNKTEINLFSQYSFLLENSVKFDKNNDDFKYQIQQFIDTCKEKRSGIEYPINPYSFNKRGGPIILYPYLFNIKYDRVIIMILTKDESLKEEPVETIQYILGKKEDANWIFKNENVSARNFRYYKNHPKLSDTEMSLRVLSTFIGWGYMKPNTLEISDKYVKNYIDENWDR